MIIAVSSIQQIISYAYVGSWQLYIMTVSGNSDRTECHSVYQKKQDGNQADINSFFPRKNADVAYTPASLITPVGFGV